MKLQFCIKTGLLFIMGFAFSCQVFAQRDYFITKKNDTVRCFLDEVAFSNKLRYLLPNSSKPVKLNTDTVFECSLDNLVYTRRLLPGDSALRFVIWVYRGRINLYELLINSGKYYTTYFYAAKGDDKLNEIKTNQLFGSRKDRMQRFYSLLDDYPELLDKFKAANNYSFEAISAAIKEYNYFYDTAKTYFITLKGDTINCKIAEKIAAANSKDSLAYKTQFATRFKALDLDTVKEYTFNNLVMTRRTFPGEADAKMLTWLERGKLNLYQYVSPRNAKSWYASKGDGPLVLVKGKGSGKEQSKAFAELIADYPELLEQFKGNNDYNEENIRLTITTYNKLKKA